MFYIAWIILTGIGIGASIAIFIWAMKSGQFSDQGRARYLPLSAEPQMPPVENPSRLSAEVYALIFILALGFLAAGGAVMLTILWL